MKLIAKILLAFVLAFIALNLLAMLVWGQPDKSVNELKEKYAQPPSAFVSVDGMEVHYRDEGNPSDTLPIVLIHGTASNIYTFQDWATALKAQKRVVRMDLPAFGLTGPFPDRNYSIAHYVDFITHFLAAKGITKCILAGNSVGGEIACAFTIAHPETVQKLILIDASGYPLISKSIPIAFRMARIPILNKLLTYITPRFTVKASVENVYADKSKVTPALVDRYFDLILRAGNRKALVDRLTQPKDSSMVQFIKTIQQPTLVLWGEKDQLIPLSYAYRYHNDLPNDTLVILKNLGHVPMEESPEESLAPVLSFLKQ